MNRKEEKEVLPRYLVEDEHLGAGVPQGDLFRFCKRLFIRLVLGAAGVVVEVFTVAVDDEHDRVRRRRSAPFRLPVLTLRLRTRAA